MEAESYTVNGYGHLGANNNLCGVTKNHVFKNGDIITCVLDLKNNKAEFWSKGIKYAWYTSVDKLDHNACFIIYNFYKANEISLLDM